MIGYSIGIALFAIGILVSVLFGLQSTAFHYNSLVFLGAAVICIVILSGDILVATLLHYLNNFSGVGDAYATWDMNTITAVFFAPFGEELAKLSFAVGITVILQSQKVFRHSTKYPIIAYSAATAIWILSHCVVYPIPFLPCW